MALYGYGCVRAGNSWSGMQAGLATGVNMNGLNKQDGGITGEL